MISFFFNNGFGLSLGSLQPLSKDMTQLSKQEVQHGVLLSMYARALFEAVEELQHAAGTLHAGLPFMIFFDDEPNDVSSRRLPTTKLCGGTRGQVERKSGCIRFRRDS